MIWPPAGIQLLVMGTLVLVSGCTKITLKESAVVGPTPSVSASTLPTATPSGIPSHPVNLTAVWANDGGNKVTRDELRATKRSSRVLNSVWDGTSVSLFSAKNEVVAFNVILEAGVSNAANVSVQFNSLTGPANFAISSVPTAANGVFNWTSRNIELFYIRYLAINGLSRMSYENYDERHIPKRFQRPYTGAGIGTGQWTDRPDHNKYYPDIAVPSEAVPAFTVKAGENQGIWVDIYVPRNAPAGLYQGSLTVLEGSNVSYVIPVKLQVRGITLPDLPNSKTMIYIDYPDVSLRYTGVSYPNAGSAQDVTAKTVRDRHFLLAHRHKISLIDGNVDATGSSSDQPVGEWVRRLDGSLFTSANGYDGPGISIGNNVFSIGTYGSWSWQSQGQSGMWTHTNNWESWFQANAPGVERFLYLIDESSNTAQIQQWGQWIQSNPGVGRNLPSFATLNIPTAVSQTPALNIAASWFTVGDSVSWQNAVNTMLATPGRKPYLYNGKRPSQGSFATEDDGVALRELAWAQYKKRIARWFFWSGTYYNDYQSGRGQTDVFSNAQTFGPAPVVDAILGQTSGNYANGDGLLFYPGTDQVFPTNSYGLAGPIASLRLKHWRRGIQDVDYLTLAAAVNPGATQTIVNQMVPKAMWEYGLSDPNDPTWVRTDISWSINPDDWELARSKLANIIETGLP